jgi:hypothetical protein
MNNLLELTKFVQGEGDLGRQRGQQNNLAKLTAQVAQGGQPDYAGIAMNGGNPLAIRDDQQKQKEQALQSLGQAAQWFAQLPPDMQAQQYPQLAQHATQLGFPVPQQFDPSFVPKIAQLAMLIGGNNATALRPMNVSPGGEIVDPTTGKVIHANSNFAPQKPVWDSARGGWAFPPGGGQVPNSAPAAAPSAALPNVQFDFAPGTPQSVIDATKAAAIADQQGQMPSTPMSGGGMGSGGGFLQVVPPRQSQRGPSALQERIDLARQLGATPEQLRQLVIGSGGQDSAPPAIPGDETKTGNDYLATLDNATRTQVQALASGRMQFPTGTALKSPYWQGMLAAVSQYDPQFDAINYNARAKTRSDFTSGKAAQSINALNTVAGHLKELQDAGDALKNSRFPTFNSVANYAENAMGDPRVKTFNATKKAVVDELTRVWRGAGGSEADIRTWSSVIDSAASPDQLHGVVTKISSLIESKIQALTEQYKQGMGIAADARSFVTPQNQQFFDQSSQGANSPKVIRYDAKGNRIP